MDRHLPLPPPFYAADDQLNQFPDDDPAANNNNNPNPEAARRPRGRPSGSKNKPKPPIIIARESANCLTSHVMEIAAGCDVLESLSSFTTRRRRGLCILSGSGAVMNVNFLQRSSPSPVLSLHGTFEILSLSGSFLPPPAPPASSSLTVYLAGGNGQVIGGIVTGPLVASRPVVVMASSFADAAYERLPPQEEEQTGMENENHNQSMMTVASSSCQLPEEPYWG